MSTLLTLLSQRARTDGARAALSFKEKGSWRQLAWARVERATLDLRRALGEAGFGEGAVLVVSKRASARTVLAVLASLSLGGTIAGVDELADKVAPNTPRWIFARDSAELARLLDAASASALSGILFDDQRGSLSVRVAVPMLNYSQLLSAEPSQAAAISAEERSILELGLASDFEAKQLVNSWLTRGFELGVPEESESTERDAGEIEVSLRIASAQSWDAWAQALRTRFAAQSTRKRRLVEWALAVSAEPLTRSRWARWASALLVVKPLRRALRLRHWRRAISLDAVPSPATALLLGGLGVRLEPWERQEIAAPSESEELTATDAAVSPRVADFARQSA